MSASGSKMGPAPAAAGGVTGLAACTCAGAAVCSGTPLDSLCSCCCGMFEAMVEIGSFPFLMSLPGSSLLNFLCLREWQRNLYLF